MRSEEMSIYLQGKKSFVPQNEQDAYRVMAGEVLVYIVPWTDGKQGRQCFLCEVKQGSVIPAFVYRDYDYQEWRFSFVAKSEAELCVMPSSVTSVLLKNFAKKIKLETFEEEGFHNGLVEYYRKEIVKDNVFIQRGEQREPASDIESYYVIKEAFQSTEARIEGDNLVYKAVAYACRHMGQEVVEYDRLCSMCGSHIEVSDIAQASHMIYREVVLDVDWYRKDCGVIIGKIDKETVACIPYGHNKYYIYDPKNNKKEKLTKSTAQTIEPRAYILGRTLPNQSLKTADLFKFCKKAISGVDIGWFIFLGVISTVIGVLLPTLNQKIYDEYIPLGNVGHLVQICVVIGTFMIGNLFFSIVNELVELRIKSHIGYELQDAVYHRLFHLPESFFRNFESADLAQRLMSVASTANQCTNAIVITGFTTIFSLIYLIRMFAYSAKLTWIALAMMVVYTVILAIINVNTIKYEQMEAENSGKASSKLYQYLNGIEKIRMAGVENRATYEYLIPFAEEQSAQIRKNRISSVGEVLSSVVTTLFSMVLYVAIVKMDLGVSMGSFIGFNAALGVFVGSILELVNKLIEIYQLRPTYDRFKPIIEAIPEDDKDSELPGKLSGKIEVNHLTFSYGEGKPNVLNDISLNIKPGEYVGIVGTSGCGKSTLLKLLLGFEKPVIGHIMYDGKDLSVMDKRAFRQNLGVVLQNGKLISGSIYENITITAPSATMKDVQKVIEAVGLKEDIAHMPMGLHTVLSENSNTISGGQQQRILIARAIIRNPSILFFDEATSALDNVTQAAVCASLDKMNATRIVIAHRLSTIKTCDRIIVLSNGKIAEEGNYDALMRQKGLFYQLASRQIAN